MTGVDNRKENFAAASLVRFLKSSAVIVIPDDQRASQLILDEMIRKASRKSAQRGPQSNQSLSLMT